jgi:type I restriction enzyme S subunit
LNEVLVSVPDHSTQTAIAEILSSLDDKIELNNKINQELETLAQTLFMQWFIDFEFPNENGEPYKSSCGEMVDSELGEIPKGWEVKPIGELFEVVVGGDWGMDIEDEEHTELNYVIRGTDIPSLLKGSKSTIPYRAIKPSKLKNRQLKVNDLVIEISGGSKDQPTGRTILITKEILERLGNHAIPASFCRLIRPKLNFAEFLGIYFTKIYKDGKTWEYQNQSTGISNFQFKYFESSELLALPDDISIINKFNELISGIYNLMTTNENISLSTARDYLLPKLISGELEINEISI